MESKETPEECLKRELREELKMEVDVGDFFTSNVHDYGSFQINLISYFCDFIESEYRMTDHDRFEWLLPEEIGEFKLAPADVPIYVKLIEKEIQN